ncbi:hypothetical protein Cgig2_008576 [Carnegiea gigantea]|uniref:Uncharacterized protein n=1 Tax=Carnegiea gigantea TaxID=171969 RepID=A0A9Q1JMN8_9CARY|nr:hypothetical protein Cgig2_008576 [Carnegiea gigantea]
MEKGPEKRKSGKNNTDKPLSKNAEKEKSPEELGKRMRCLLKAAVQKGHVSNMELFNSSDLEENDLTYECKEVDHDDNQREGKEEATIYQNEQQPLKFEEKGSNEKRTYQKAFITRMTTLNPKEVFQMACRELLIHMLSAAGFQMAEVFGHNI